MRFYIEASSCWDSCDVPINYPILHNYELQMEGKLVSIEIKDLQELYELVDKVNHPIIISGCIFDHKCKRIDAPTLEIYDDYRE